MTRAPPTATCHSHETRSDERTGAMPQLCATLLLAGLAGAAGVATTWLVINRHALADAWWHWRRHRPIPVEIMVADRRQRRHLERALAVAIRQLGNAHGSTPPASTLIVQQIVWDGWGGDGGRQIHGCARRPSRFAADPRPRHCLALEVDGRALPLDEILATLAELWSLHLKSDDRDFVPIILGPATPPRRVPGAPAPLGNGTSPLAADD